MADGLDPRTPVIIGTGQLNQRVDRGAEVLEPVDLMAEASVHRMLTMASERGTKPTSAAPCTTATSSSSSKGSDG